MAGASIGASGLALALGAYSATQVTSMKAELDGMKDDIFLLNTTGPIVVGPTKADDAFVFTESGVAEITELQTAHALIETDVVSLDLNLGSTDTKLETLRGEFDNMVDTTLPIIDERTTSNLGLITASESNIVTNTSDISTNTTNISTNTTNISTNTTNISTNDASITGILTRLDVLDVLETGTTVVNAANIATNLGRIEDIELELANTDNQVLTDLTSEWNDLNDVLSQTNGILTAGNLTCYDAKLGIQINNGQSHNYSFNTTSNAWSMYLANSASSSKNPSGGVPQTHPENDITDYAIRIAISGSNGRGIIFEDQSGSPFWSVNHNGNMVAGTSKVFDVEADTAAFAHVDYATASNYAMKQVADGRTYLNTPANGTLHGMVGNDVKFYSTAASALNIRTNHGVTPDSFFGKNGQNLIASDTGTYFTTTDRTPRVVITNDEVEIDGIRVHGTIMKMLDKIAYIEHNYLNMNKTVIMGNHKRKSDAGAASNYYMDNGGNFSSTASSTNAHLAIQYDAGVTEYQPEYSFANTAPMSDSQIETRALLLADKGTLT